MRFRYRLTMEIDVRNFGRDTWAHVLDVMHKAEDAGSSGTIPEYLTCKSIEMLGTQPE
jgi:hypothetical protein